MKTISSLRVIRTGILLIMLIATQTACRVTADPLVLVSDGRPVAVLVLSSDAVPLEKEAAAILNTYVRKMSGVSLPEITADAYQEGPAVWIGRAAEGRMSGSVPGAEGYQLTVSDQSLFIRGGSGRGLLYGVYTLLETYFGCRKYDQRPAFVPKRTTLELPGNLQDAYTPVFEYRESFYPASMDQEYLDWHKLHRFEDRWGVWGHSAFKMVPPGTYFSAHPEYFALVNGQRQASQLCMSHPDVLKLTVNWLKEAIAENTDAVYWSVAPMDGGGFCTCDQCSRTDREEGGHQGSLVRFVNKVADQFPDKKITTLAYTYTADPPGKTKPAANVYMMLSSIDAQRHQPLEQALGADAFRKQLAGWGALTANLMVWDYTVQFTNYLAPFPVTAFLQPNLRYMQEKGVKGVFEQGSGYTYGDMAELNSYLLAKALWKPQEEMTAIREDFLTGYYGKAAPAISAYLNALEHAVSETGAVLDIYGNPVNNRKDYLSPGRIDQYSQLLDKAEAAAEGDTLLTARVNRVRFGTEYTVLQQSRLFGRDQYGYLAPDEDEGGVYRVKSNWPERVNRFVKVLERSGVTEMAEAGVTPEQYRKEWEELFSRGWIPALSVDRPVRLEHAFMEDYPAKGEATLTDGIPGTSDYSYNWLLFEGTDLVATIDLGRVQPVQSVQINYLDDPRHYMFSPVQVRAEMSADGRTFTEITVVRPAPSEDQPEALIKAVTLAGSTASQGRYVRVTAVCPSAFPPWFTGNPARKPVIAFDEITVR